MLRKGPVDAGLTGQPLSKEHGRNCRKAADYRGVRVGPQQEKSSAASCRPTAVLDTNAVLALYWFEDARVARLGLALQSGGLKWLASIPMRQELVRVLGRLQAAGPVRQSPEGAAQDGEAAQSVIETFDRLATLMPSPGGPPAPRCTDADDQKFIDLALHGGAGWLLSRDRAVLKLRHRLLALGNCRVMRREDWAP